MPHGRWQIRRERDGDMEWKYEVHVRQWKVEKDSVRLGLWVRARLYRLREKRWARDRAARRRRGSEASC